MLSWFLVTSALADTPMYADVFALAYEDVPAVAEAKAAEKMDSDVATTLLDATVPLDVKTAVVATLGYGTVGHTPNAPALAEMLGNKYGKPAKDVLAGKVKGMSGEDQFVLGYMLAMDYDLHIWRAMPLLDGARASLPNSYIVALIDALAHAKAGAQAGCKAALREAYTLTQSSSLTVDVRPRVYQAIDSGVRERWRLCEG